MSIFIGSGVALCTPFCAGGNFDGDVYEKLIHFHAQSGTAAIVTCGTTGEVSTLTQEEHIEVVRTAVLAAKKQARKMPVIAGAGGNDTAQCVRMGQALKQAGADALMYVTPYYNKASQGGLLAHYQHIAANVDMPIIVYNVPSRTTVNLQPKTLAQLANLPNIQAVKEASGDISQIAEVAERCDGKLDIYVGNDDQILPTLSLGGVGVISTVANIVPTRVQGIVDAFLQGDVLESRRLQLGILPLVRLMFADVNPMPVKAALRLMGYNMGQCRLPLTDISLAHASELAQIMKAKDLV